MDHITTPFGRRTMTLGMAASQVAARDCPENKAAHKWHVFRWIAEAKDVLCVSDRALAVLNALLTCLPDTAMTPGPELTVFPSNVSLSLRAHGMPETTLRRQLAALVFAGIIIRRDSPNGKRYARRGEQGIEEAFGFDLTPVLARSDEFERLATEARARKRAAALARERVTIYRRDISKCIEAGTLYGEPDEWRGYDSDFSRLSMRLPRRISTEELEDLAGDLHGLAIKVGKSLEGLLELQNPDGNDYQNGAHLLNSNADPNTELEPAFEKAGGLTEPKPQTTRTPASGLPLGAILRACPDIAMYDRSEIRSWRDLIATAGVVRGALGISPSAWDDARSTMGDVDAAVTIAGILQRTDEINSPGGYLRGLTERSRAGRYSTGPMIMALMRKASQRSNSTSGGS